MLKLALNKSMCQCDNEQGINKLRSMLSDKFDIFKKKKKRRRKQKSFLCSGSMLNGADPIFALNIKIWAQTS